MPVKSEILYDPNSVINAVKQIGHRPSNGRRIEPCHRKIQVDPETHEIVFGCPSLKNTCVRGLQRNGHGQLTCPDQYGDIKLVEDKPSKLVTVKR